MCRRTLVSYTSCGCEPEWSVPFCNGTPLTKAAVDRLHLDYHMLPVQACFQARISKIDRNNPQAAKRSRCDDFFWKSFEIAITPCYRCFHQLENTCTVVRIRNSMQTCDMSNVQFQLLVEQNHRTMRGLSQDSIHTLATPRNEGQPTHSFRIRTPFSWRLCKDSQVPDVLEDETVVRRRKVIKMLKAAALGCTRSKGPAEKRLPQERTEEEKKRRRELNQERLAKLNQVAGPSKDQTTLRDNQMCPASPDSQITLVLETSPRHVVKLPATTAMVARKLKPGALDLGPPGTYSYTSLRYPPGHGEESLLQDYQPTPRYAPKQPVETECFACGQRLPKPTNDHNNPASGSKRPKDEEFELNQQRPERVHIRRRRNDGYTKCRTGAARKKAEAVAVLPDQQQHMQPTQAELYMKSESVLYMPRQQQLQWHDRSYSLEVPKDEDKSEVISPEAQISSGTLRPEALAFVPGKLLSQRPERLRGNDKTLNSYAKECGTRKKKRGARGSRL